MTNQWSAGRRIAVATVIAGTLDILAAMGMTLYFGGQIPNMLRYVASGPFAAAKEWGTAGAALGLVTHFTLMAIMATGYVLTADRVPALKRQPLLWGVLFGLVTYVAMNLIVVPLRFDTALPHTVAAIGRQLFCHIVLVGIPIAFVARK
jgi:uncharacterized membrane protein YagU involved in acid resistance